MTDLPPTLHLRIGKRWVFFPVRGKRPLTPNGFKDATNDSAKLARWSRDFPGCGWAAPTGERNGFDVLDADTQEAVADLESRLPLGPRVRTGRGGCHFYLRHSPGARNWTKRLPGTDFRGEGGYVVLPGSPHESGTSYSWVEGTAELELPDAPAWLDEIHVRAPASRAEGTRYREGERNDRLFRIASAVRAKGGNVLEEILRANNALCSPPLGRQEVQRIAESVRRYPDAPGPPPSLAPDALWGWNDKGEAPKPNRARFVETISTVRSFATVEDTEEVLVFEGGFYRPQAGQLVHRWVEERFRERGRTSSINFRREVFAAVQALSYIPRNEFDPQGFLALKNGLLDLRDPAAPKFSPHDPAVRLTFGLPVEYHPEAECPGFMRFLEETQPDAEVRLLLQEEAGYVLVPGNQYKTAFFWVGERDSGKSTFQSILRAVYGPKNVSAISLQSLADNRFASAGLNGKLANLFADLSPKVVRDIGLFKMLTGATDEVPAEKKFQTAFSFVNRAKLFFSANEMPPVPVADEAFYRRWIVTRFANRVPLERQDPGLASRLAKEEGPGILNWMIEGLARLVARGRFELPSTVVETGRTWRRMSDSLAWFVESEMIPEHGARVSKEEFYARYTEWCEDRGGNPRTVRDVGVSLPALVPGLRTAFPKPGGKGARTVRSWEGLRLREPGEHPASAAFEAYTMPQQGVEPVEPVELAPALAIRSTHSTGSTRVLGIGEVEARTRWEDDGGRAGGVP